jgi:hypothetical protein
MSGRLSVAVACGLLLAVGNLEAGVLPGASRLQEPLAGRLSLTPVLPELDHTVLSLGLVCQGSVRSNLLSAAVWNRYAGRTLGEADKEALLRDVGSSFELKAEGEVALLEGVWRSASGDRLGLRVEHLISASQDLDIRLLRVALLGNDPTQPLEIRRANLAGEVLQRVRLAWSRELPPAWAGRLGLDEVEGGLGLFVEQGSWLSRTRSISARAEPPQGQVSGVFEHVQESAGPGLGWGLDAGLSGSLPLAGKPLRLHAALRGLPHLQVWRQVQRTTRRYELPATPVDVSFDYEAFSVELLDSTWTQSSHDLHLSRRPGWLLAADWESGRWRHSLLAEQLPQDARGGGLRRLSAATRLGWGSWFWRLELSGGLGRGPALGAETGWDGRHWKLAVGGSGYAGLGQASRGAQLGLECRWLLP